MAAMEQQALIWAFTTVQLVGLASALMVRFTTHHAAQASFQWIFFAVLAVVALTTLGSISIGWEAWAISGGTLGVMAVAAVWDPGTRAQLASQS